MIDAKVAWVSEFEKAPSKILARRYPDAPNHGDVTKIDWSAVEPVDIITGGSPCQDLSHAGKRAGMKAGTRSGLWASMCDAIETIRPSLVVWENVRGALTAEGEPPTLEILDLEAERERTRRAITTVNRRLRRAQNNGEDSHVQYHRRDAVLLLRHLDRQVGAVRRERAGLVRAIGRVVGDLADLGYDAAWCGLRAADVDAPHGRYRIFVLAWPATDSDDDGRRIELPWGSEEAQPRAANAPSATDVALLPTPVVNDMGAGKTVDAWDAWTERLKASHGNGNGHGASLSIEALRLLPTPMTANNENRQSDGYGPNLGGALLPTPRALDATGVRGRTANRAAEANARAGQTLTDVTEHLLPTPMTVNRTSSKAKTGRPTSGPSRGGPSYGLEDVVQLMPTPRATRGGSGTETMYGLGGERTDADRTQGQVTLANGTDFGIYGPAVARWEHVLGRPAPPPTEPTGRGGAERLSARFVEFMMGLPDGWVTDIDISRNEQLKALGNGVVPQQCATALRHLLTIRAAQIGATS